VCRQAYAPWRAYGIYLSALLIFASSRLVVFFGVNFGTLLVRDPDPAKWDAGPAWYHRLLRWDSGWYGSIVTDGYRYSEDATVQGPTVFYPLYPLVSYWVQALFGVSHWAAMLLVANVASLVVVLLMAKFVRDELGDEVALLSIAFFCFFPASLFLSAGYSESLFLLFVLFSFILLTREKFVLAALLAGGSLGTRVTGIVMLPVILFEMWRRSSMPWPRLLPRMALCSVLAASGLLAYMAFLGIKFGNPLAFATHQAAWHGASLQDRVLSGVMLAPFLKLNWANAAWDAAWFVCFLILLIGALRRLTPAISLYGFGVLALPYFLVGISHSMNRYVLVCFPAFMAMALLCKGRPWLTLSAIGMLAALLMRNAALFSQWHWAG